MNRKNILSYSYLQQFAYIYRRGLLDVIVYINVAIAIEESKHPNIHYEVPTFIHSKESIAISEGTKITQYQ